MFCTARATLIATGTAVPRIPSPMTRKNPVSAATPMLRYSYGLLRFRPCTRHSTDTGATRQLLSPTLQSKYIPSSARAACSENTGTTRALELGLPTGPVAATPLLLPCLIPYRYPLPLPPPKRRCRPNATLGAAEYCGPVTVRRYCTDPCAVGVAWLRLRCCNSSSGVALTRAPG